jgi:hypothetical protein
VRETLRDGTAVGRFIYGRSYRSRPDAVEIDLYNLPISDKEYVTTKLRGVFGALRDAAPDSWGRYVIDPDGAGPARSLTVRSPDFNFRSLRGTGVLRWEWRPGSTAYLVWTQRRSGREAVGDFDFGRDRAALLSAPADNIFLLKVSYWLGL